MRNGNGAIKARLLRRVKVLTVPMRNGNAEVKSKNTKGD